LEQKKNVVLCIDLCPDESLGQIFSLLTERFVLMSYKNAQEAMNGWLHKKLIPILLREAQIPASKPSGTLTKQEIGRLAALLKRWPFPAQRLDGWGEAQVTVGGVVQGEVKDELESRRHAGLFFAGEVLDLDGDCGGYNLQWAVSSGYIAGVAAARASMRG
jgi:hypothetical protein